MFMYVLAALDDSPRAKAALRAASELTRLARGQLVALHVEASPGSDTNLSSGDVAAAEETRSLRSHGTPAHYIIQHGTPEWQVLATARRQRSNVIVVAPRPRGTWRAGLRVSLTERLCAHSAVPVLIVPCPESETADARECFGSVRAPVLVPLDGSVMSEAALPWAVDLARVLDRPLTLLHVSTPLASQDDVAMMHAYLNTLQDRIAPLLPRPVEISLVRGAPADEIIWAAEGRDVAAVIMTAYGASGSTDTLGGSISGAVRKRARWPLLYITPLALESARASNRSGRSGTFDETRGVAEGDTP